MSENNDANPTTPPTVKPKRWKRRVTITATLFLALGLLAWFLLFRDTSLEISRETTYITEPLTADGKRVDYFRALEQEFYPPTMKTDDNGYRLIVRVLGPAVDPTTPGAETLAKQAYEKLGLDPNTKPTMTYQDPFDFLTSYTKAHPEIYGDEDNKGFITIDLEEKTYRPWTLKELPMMATWLKQNEPAADLLVEAARKPAFRYPLIRMNDKESLPQSMSWNKTVGSRSFARTLNARANYRIATGNLDGAIDDIIAIKALGRHLSHQNTMVDVLVGLCYEWIASSIGIAEVLDHQPTEVQLQRLLDEIQNLPPRATVKNTAIFERFHILSCVQLLATGESPEFLDDLLLLWGIPEFEQSLSKAVKIFDFNWNAVMKRINWYFDDPTRIRQLNAKTIRRDNPWQSLNSLPPSSRSEFLADYMIKLLLFDNFPSQEAHNRSRCIDRITAITLAMLIYEKQHGHLPPAYTVDENGKPLHSWRVLLLPYLGKEAKKLHAKIKLDEPWDSTHNRQFHDAAVEFYQCPSAKLKPGQTTYSVVVGEKTAFQAGEGKTLDQFGPDSANMILVLENPATPACWMDPTSDLTESTAPKALDNKSVHPGIILVGQRSGSVSPISTGVNRENFRQGLEGTKVDWLE